MRGTTPPLSAVRKMVGTRKNLAAAAKKDKESPISASTPIAGKSQANLLDFLSKAQLPATNTEEGASDLQVVKDKGGNDTRVVSTGTNIDQADNPTANPEGATTGAPKAGKTVVVQVEHHSLCTSGVGLPSQVDLSINLSDIELEDVDDNTGSLIESNKVTPEVPLKEVGLSIDPATWQTHLAVITKIAEGL